jgi:GNAT superfamily N-acetyltransferase
MSVRRAVSGDEAIVRAVRLRALADAPDAFESTLEFEAGMTPEDWSRRIAKWATFLYEPAGHSKGIVAAVPYDGEPGAILLVSMWVEPTVRGSGAADALVAAVLDWAKSQGAREVVLHVGKGNGRARSFYRKMGFRDSGHAFVSERTGIEEVEMRHPLRAQTP